MRPVSKFVITVLVLTLSVVLLSSYKGKAQPQGVGPQQPDDHSFQGSERAIRRIRHFNPPVSIEAVKTKGRSVPLDKKFIDEDDWLKGFTVLVRNNSNKTVTHVGVELLFRPIGGGMPAARMLYYGPDPFLNKNLDVAPSSTLPRRVAGRRARTKVERC